jgi:alkanesulfonate monooxygenase SsuD/methylene tetrahydromethanopterin reductase-like flavin-dependent oxidoreductase (luciferase family)
MTLDGLLKQHTAWLEQAMKRPPFGKVDEAATKFPEEQRQHRMAELRARIGDLNRRKVEAAGSYDRAIALEEAELKAIDAQRPPTPPPTGGPRGPQSLRKAARSARK